MPLQPEESQNSLSLVPLAPCRQLGHSCRGGCLCKPSGRAKNNRCTVTTSATPSRTMCAASCARGLPNDIVGDLRRGGKVPAHRDFHASRAIRAGDGRRGVRLGVQTTVSDRGTLAPARLVAITTAPAPPDRRVSALIRVSRPSPSRNHQSPHSTFRGIAPTRPAAIDRAVKQQQSQRNTTCAGDCR